MPDLARSIGHGARVGGLGLLVAFLLIVVGASEARPAILAADQVGTVLVIVVDQTGAPVPYADIVTVIEGFDFYGHTTADADGHETKSLLTGRRISICADYHYLHSTCGPGFVLAPGETRSVTLVLDLAGGVVVTPASPTQQSSRSSTNSSGTPAAAPPTPTASASALPPCRFVLGFKALHDLLPTVVGGCVDDESHNTQNGDGLQHSKNGLLVWRKADNVAAFTDGYHTWVNGPKGLQERLNTQRFAWEANPDGLTLAP